MSEFMEAFFEDAREHLAMMEQDLLGLEAAPQNVELVDGIFRGAHTIKGNSLMLSLNEIANLTHVLESLLDRMRAKTIAVLPEYVSVLLHATDVLSSLLRAAKGKGEPSSELAAVTEQLHQVLEANGADAAPETVDAAGYCAEATAQSGKSPTDAQPDRDEVHDASATGCEQSPEPATPAASETAQRKPAAKSGGAAHTEASSIRVSIDKVDELINLVGELAIAQSMVNQAIRDLPIEIAPMLEEAMAAMERSTREVQERVMSVRMLPVGTIFRRFPRVVRDLSSGLSKKVELEIVGEETELDKQVIEQISDPLTHLIRNAIDHGIETPEKRLAAGKPAEGTLRLNRTFGINGGITDPSEGLVVIVENQGRKVGLLVDELLGQLQVVMKSVEEHYEKVDGICGATILGDGRVALIIDIGGVDWLG